MTETINIKKGELARMEERIRSLATEKSYLQLVIRMMSKVATVPGLEDTIINLIRNIADVIGGANIILYYKVDNIVFYCDVFGKKLQIKRIEDNLVRQVFHTHEPMEVEHDFADTKMTTPEFTKAYTWVYPLLVGPDLIGVLKMESLNIDMRELYDKLPIFFNYAALVLKNEIQSHSRLKKAHDELSVINAQLTKEISEKKKTEENLLLQEKFTSSLLENIPDGVVACDSDGILSLFNRTAREWHGMDLVELPQERWAKQYDLFDADGKTPLNVDLVPLARAYRGEQVKNVEMSIVAKGQLPRYVLANASPFYDELGNKLGAVAVMLDITARRQAEETLKAAKEELEKRVYERTAELKRAYDELHTSNEELEERVMERTAELKEKNAELEKLNKMFVGRELMMIELKGKLKKCQHQK